MNEAETSQNMPKQMSRNAARRCPPACWRVFARPACSRQGARRKPPCRRRPCRSSRPASRRWRGCFRNWKSSAFIGKGGMGAVYKARQPALDRSSR